MISEIYRKYFQKSFTFLYPLLGFNKSKHPKPENVYTYSDSSGIQLKDRKLICVYKKNDTEAWKQFELKHLITHKNLEHSYPMDDETVAYVFDLEMLGEDFDVVIAGKYSKLSNPAKKILTDYYGVHTPEWVYIESFLFPEKYFKQYAQILNVDEDILRNVGELCEKPNLEKENCPHDIQMNFFINQTNP
jgi:hypothetical protein